MVADTIAEMSTEYRLVNIYIAEFFNNSKRTAQLEINLIQRIVNSSDLTESEKKRLLDLYVIYSK